MAKKKESQVIEKWFRQAHGDLRDQLKALKWCGNVINHSRVQYKLIEWAKIRSDKVMRYEASKMCQKYKLSYKGNPIIAVACDDPIQSYIDQVKPTFATARNSNEHLTLNEFLQKFRLLHERAFWYLGYRYGDTFKNWMKNQILNIPNYEDVIILHEDEPSTTAH